MAHSNNEYEDGTLFRCDVTGKLIRPEEAVEYQGRYMSREGREYLMRRAPDVPDPAEEAEPPVLVRPSLAKRLVGTVIDGLLLIAFDYFLMQALVPFVTGVTPSLREMAANPVNQIVNVETRVLYYIVLHFAFGKTLGKFVCGYRVVNLDGTPLSFKTALARSFWSNGLQIIPVAVALFSDRWFGVAQYAVHLYHMLNGLVLFLDEDEHRALHDRLAGTRVVLDHPPPPIPEEEPEEPAEEVSEENMPADITATSRSDHESA